MFFSRISFAGALPEVVASDGISSIRNPDNLYLLSPGIDLKFIIKVFPENFRMILSEDTLEEMLRRISKFTAFILPGPIASLKL